AGALCRVRLECKLSAGELVSDLVEVLTAILETKTQAVLAVSPRDIIDKLERVVVDGIRTVLRVADGDEAVPGKGGERNAPGDRGPSLQTRNADRRNRVDVVGGISS